MTMPVLNPGRPIPFDEYVEHLRARLAAVGPIDVPRNAGNRRTESKRALLKAIEEAGGRW